MDSFILGPRTQFGGHRSSPKQGFLARTSCSPSKLARAQPTAQAENSAGGLSSIKFRANRTLGCGAISEAPASKWQEFRLTARRKCVSHRVGCISRFAMCVEAKQGCRFDSRASGGREEPGVSPASVSKMDAAPGMRHLINFPPLARRLRRRADAGGWTWGSPKPGVLPILAGAVRFTAWLVSAATTWLKQTAICTHRVEVARAGLF